MTLRGLEIAGMLVDSSTTGEWNLQGLPTDELSIQNGILTTRARRYPLMVNPQGQGLRIRSKESENGVKETSFQDKGFRVLSERVTVIDFTVTIKGLEGQLLAKVVLQEKPELEYERTKLQVEVNGYQKKRVELQDDLLYCLSSCGGSLMDDPEIVNVLNLGKATAKEVGEKLKKTGRGRPTKRKGPPPKASTRLMP